MRNLLPDNEPFRAWTNFELIAHDGSINEVDLFVVTPEGVFVVELKHWVGTITGGQTTWQVTKSGGSRSEDNHALLVNKKAKRLRALLEDQSAFNRVRPPYFEALVFLSHPDVRVQLDQARQLRDRVQARYPGSKALPNRPALDALLRAVGFDAIWEPGTDGGEGAYVVRYGQMSASQPCPRGSRQRTGRYRPRPAQVESRTRPRTSIRGCDPLPRGASSRS